MEFVVMVAASGGARWDRFFGIVLVFLTVLVIRTVLVHLMEHPDDAARGPRDDDASALDR